MWRQMRCRWWKHPRRRRRQIRSWAQRLVLMLIQGIRTFERKRSPRMIERMWSPRIVERTGPPGTVVSKRRHIKHRRAFECGHGCVTLLRVVGCSGGGCSRPGRGNVRQLGDLRLPLRRWHWRCNFAWAEHLNANRGIFKRERARCTTSILVLWRRGRVAMGGGSGGEASSWADLALARARAACGVSARRMRCREARTKSPAPVRRGWGTLATMRRANCRASTDLGILLHRYIYENK